MYYLSTCSTCKKIIKELELSEEVILQDLKSEPLTKDQLEDLKQRAGSYEALFSKHAQLYKSKGLKDRNLSEADFKNYLLEHYTFLKRPVLIYNGQIFIGNSKTTVEAAKTFIHTHE